MSVLSLTLPMLPGKAEAWRRFCQEMRSSHREAYEVSRLRLGINRERFELVQTAVGTAVLITIVAEDIGQTLTAMATADSFFDHWFKEKLEELHGFSLTTHINHSLGINPNATAFSWSTVESY